MTALVVLWPFHSIILTFLSHFLQMTLFCFNVCKVCPTFLGQSFCEWPEMRGNGLVEYTGKEKIVDLTYVVHGDPNGKKFHTR